MASELLNGGERPSCPECEAPMRWQPDGWDCGTIRDHGGCGGRIWFDPHMRAWVAIQLRRMKDRLVDAIH